VEAPAEPWTPDLFPVPPCEGKLRFQDLDMPLEVMHAIADLGFQYCTPVQAKVLPQARKGCDVTGKAQTGTGKTAAFLVSMFSRFLDDPDDDRVRPHGAPRALILAPTRELCIQIVKDAHDLGRYCKFHTVAVYGGMDYDKQRNSLERPVDLIAATPGRLLDFCSKGVVNLRHVQVLVIDEADRMLDMGFIPDVTRIVRQTPPREKRQTMLFSATLTDDVMRLASQWMRDPVVVEVDPDQVTAATIEEVVYLVKSNEKLRVLFNLITKRALTRVLIFCNRRCDTRELTERLVRLGVTCEMLSGEVDQKKRLRILEDFRSGALAVVIATDVAGRGLHVEGISHVVNFDFPYEADDYVHRIGRTGRVGTYGIAVSFACEDESFVIPEIEKYVGHPLPCRHPEPELLEELPPMGPPPPRSDEDRSGGGGGRPPRRDSRGGGPRDSRGGGPRRSGPPRR
jgi:ATP-dependent RNA helicase RhlB